MNRFLDESNIMYALEFIIENSTTPPTQSENNSDTDSDDYETDSNQSVEDNHMNHNEFFLNYTNDNFLNEHFNIISKNIGINDYYEKVDNLRLSKHIYIIKKLIDNIFSVYDNSIICGDIVSTLYLYDNLLNTELNSLNLKFTQIYVIHEYRISLESIISKLNKFACINYNNTDDEKNVISITVRDDQGYIYNIYIHLFYTPSLYSNLMKSNSPYWNKENVELNISDNDVKKYYFLNRFKHHRLSLISNGWAYDYTIIDKIQDKYVLIPSEKSKDLIDSIKNKKLQYIENEDVKMLNPYKELEIFFSNFNFNNIIMSRLNIFIHTNIILFFIQKGWIFDNMSKELFDENDICFICCNKVSDFSNDYKNLDIYKISIKCCKESINGICLKCFIQNSIECYKSLKSHYICPFCKKEHCFYNKEIHKFLIKS